MRVVVVCVMGIAEQREEADSKSRSSTKKRSYCGKVVQSNRVNLLDGLLCGG
jgi:hypothetical protein